MNIFAILLLGIGLSMDAFAVSICKGLCMKKADIKGMAICGSWFGGFQGLMPMIGFFIGSLFAKAIEAFDHWVAFGLLALIGVNMIKESLTKEECTSCDIEGADMSVKTMFVMAVATSIDALAVGVSLSMAGNVNIWFAAGCIAITTFILSAVGVKVGSIFGSKYEKKAEFLGGVILIILGIKILLEHTL